MLYEHHAGALPQVREGEGGAIFLTVAEQYPARTDDNGNTWYRPANEGLKMWGWTSDPTQAHIDYGVSK